ncbi:hypothetical protein LCGC14_0893630 [marine sediment metagenome]|uniref:Uncharacterized protein n=1 Tax=marine sediment metagenome TaxID=412755 RepID=A0A0F9P3B4_9ZZZZ
MPTKEELINYSRKYKIRGVSKFNKTELEKIVNKHKKMLFEKNKHKWRRKDITVSSGIAFAVWECEKCGKEEDTMIGEILNPSEI